MQRLVHHVRVQVAGAAGRDLNGRDALGADALGIVLGLEVALDDGDAQVSADGVQRRFQQARLAEPGEDMRFTASTPWASRWARLCAACWSFSPSRFANTSTAAWPEAVSACLPPGRTRCSLPGVTLQPQVWHMLVFGLSVTGVPGL
jgi:hypothetical protein